MKLLAQTFSVLSLFGLASAGCTENQYGTDGCEPDPFLCRITCNKEDQPACQKEEFDSKIPVCANITIPENYEDFEANNCESYCASSDAEEDETKRCRFWRFDHLQKTKTCSLMSDSQCEVFDPCFGHCQCGDIGCPDDTNPAPPGKACAAPIGFQKNHIHWTCHNTGISTGEIPNPYRSIFFRKVTTLLSTLTVLPPRSYLLPLSVPQFLSVLIGEKKPATLLWK